MYKSPVGLFGAIWFCVVVSVLTIFALCKLGGTWFNMSPGTPSPAPKSAVERMYDDCLSETNGHNTNNCNAVLGVKQ